MIGTIGCFIVDLDTDVLVGVHGMAAANLTEVATLMVVVLIQVLRAVHSTSVAEDGETVEIDAIGLNALEDFQEATFAHRSVVFVDGDGVARTGGLPIVTLLIVVDNQFVTAQFLWENMIRRELVNDVFLILIVTACRSVGVGTSRNKEILNILNADIFCGFAELRFPQGIGFSKDGKTIFTMLWHGTWLVGLCRMVRQILDLIGQIHDFPDIVTCLAECIFKSNRLNELGHHQESPLILCNPLPENVRHRVVAGSNDSMNLMNAAIDGFNVTIVQVDECHTIDEDGVCLSDGSLVNLAIVQVGCCQLVVIVLGGDVADFVNLTITATVDDTVKDNDLANRV